MRHAQLKAFHAVATWGGFSRAASQLGISQPALSEHVRKLEELYGVELFVRARRSVMLTDIGRRLYALTERQFEAEAAALELLSRAGGLESGQLTIGADAAVHVLPLIASFRARYPRIRVRVISGNSQRLMEQLDRFEIDFAVVAEAPASPAYEARLLSEDRLVAFVPRAHSLGRRKQIGFATLAQSTLILREPGSVTRRLVEEEFARRGLALSDAIEVEGREGAREAVARGLGVGIVSAGEFLGDPRLTQIRLADWQAVMREWLVCLSARAGLQMISAVLDLAGRTGPEASGGETERFREGHGPAKMNGS